MQGLYIYFASQFDAFKLKIVEFGPIAQLVRALDS